MADYFEFLDNASIGRSYDWSSLHIDLDFDKVEIDLDAIINKTREFGYSKQETLFIHEYVHYLQSFFTTWGALAFCEYLLALEKLGASILEEHFKLSMPVELEEKAEMNLWNAGVKQYQKFFRLLGTSRDIVFERPNKYPNYIVKEVSENTLKINNGLISYEIDNKTVREHMAELSSMLFLNYSDDDIHARFEESRAFCSSTGNLDLKPMYWILFEYFYFHKYQNVAEGLVLLTHGALCSLAPYWTITRLFEFITDYKQYIEREKDLLKTVQLFFKTSREARVLSKSYEAVIEEVVKQIEMCEKRRADHHFYSFVYELLNSLLENLRIQQSGNSYFDDPSKLRKKEFWVDIIFKAGTPIIRYKDKKPVITPTSEKLEEPLIYFLGVSVLLKDLQKPGKTSCPFHTDFNICKASYRNDDGCLHEPITVKNPERDGKECHYRNSLILLGLLDRLEE